jgi:hypothetical protein
LHAKETKVSLLLKKNQNWEASYHNAVDWKFNTGAGLDSPGDIGAELVKIYKHYFALEPTMKDHGMGLSHC